ncbi:MAG: hypothetical protein DWQ36_16325 [Acidobacteria bacterium]|nr:MAG: hypothetical protein DWQ30_16395 [Acidobacteriota bacterium]REK05373.1 MAG: hypothetical protein DWQ36_16325 [Acidobacteriota bacterium]
MRSRWFHAPELHSPKPGEERRVAWIELFYDLVYVATIIQLGDALSRRADLVGFLGFAALFAAIWYAWTGYTFYSNRFRVDDSLHRLLVFVKMFGIACMAVLAPGVFEGETRPFAFAYVLVRLVIVLFYVRAWLQVEEARALSARYATWFGVGAAFWLVSAFVPPPWVWSIWAVGLTIELTAPFGGRLRELTLQHPPDAAHMAERYGLLTIIVLGESFVKVLSDLADSAERVGWGTAGQGGLALLITCSVWWIYFDDVVHSRIRPRPGARYIWLYSHLPLAIGITALGVGFKKAVGHDPDVAASTAHWLLTGSLALVFASVAVLDWVTERDESQMDDAARVWMRAGSVVVVLAIGIVGAITANWVILALIAAVCVAQVMADLAIAPMSDHEMDSDLLRSTFRAVRSADSVRRAEVRGRMRDPLEAVRKGAPSGLKRGLYYFFMHGSWARLFSAAVIGFLLANLVFAALYIMQEGSVRNADPRSLLDAFSFSVQTFATIGYGTLQPDTPYAHGLVVAEAICGLAFTALMTGLFFAKASRPTASVLFSEPATITRFEGRPALVVRLANARGNEVIEASIRLSALCDEVTEDGHRMRRVRDMALVRDSQPLFSLSWTVIHPIDERSPLHGLDEHDVEDRILAVIATVTGYDGTYARTVHARHFWYPDQFRWRQRFVDVMSLLDDGRLAIDYRMFHDTRPDPAEP